MTCMMGAEETETGPDPLLRAPSPHRGRYVEISRNLRRPRVFHRRLVPQHGRRLIEHQRLVCDCRHVTGPPGIAGVRIARYRSGDESVNEEAVEEAVVVKARRRAATVWWSHPAGVHSPPTPKAVMPSLRSFLGALTLLAALMLVVAGGRVTLASAPLRRTLGLGFSPWRGDGSSRGEIGRAPVEVRRSCQVTKRRFSRWL